MIYQNINISITGDKETSPEAEAKKEKEAKAGGESKPEDQNQMEGDEEPAEDYLRSVGETVAAMLDPLGTLLKDQVAWLIHVKGNFFQELNCIELVNLIVFENLTVVTENLNHVKGK